MARPSWSTSALGGGETLLPPDQDALGEHLRHCRGEAGRSFVLRCGAESVQGFVTGRLLTSLLLVLAVLAATHWLVA